LDFSVALTRAANESETVRHLTKIVMISIVLCLYTQDADVRGQLDDAPSSRQEFAKPKSLRFEFIDITKTKQISKDFSGKVIVIDCWATWCKPCQKSLPELSEMKKKFRDKIVILGISFDKSLETVKAYLQDDDIGRGVNYPIVFGPHLARFWDDVSVLPTIFLIDKSGRLRCRYRGYTPQIQLETDINKLLAEN
jgi:cytochrome c biogenesis protein CcmG/thiol:disulfide interchange protein DsbE